MNVFRLSTNRGGSPYTGISETPTPKWQAYPNPAKHSITLNSGVTDPVSYQLYDMSGRVLPGFSGEFSYSNTLDLSSLASGLYFVKIHRASESTTIKLMKE